MAVSNNNIRQVDLPTWEWLRFAPVATGAISALATSEDGDNRYLYYLVGSAFYRYDTHADSWQQLASPNIAPSVGCSLRYTSRRGYHGKVLGATASTVNIAGLRGNTFNGETISIESGTGAGQERVLSFTDFNNEIIHDGGVITSTTANYIADSTKKWKINQWAGYNIAITYGVNSTQYKKIIYNDSTTLYISDSNLQMHEPWNNQPYIANAPYSLPSISAGSQSHYQILSHTFSLNSNWTVTPDTTSYFTIKTDGLFLFSSTPSPPFIQLQYYDIAQDQWQTKTVPQGMVSSAFATDMSIERFCSSVIFESGTATSGDSRSLYDTSKTLEVDRYKNHRLKITSGTGVGQSRRIICNNSTSFHIGKPWKVSPDSTSTYAVHGEYNKLVLCGNGSSSLYEYNIEEDMWIMGSGFDYGLTTNISCFRNDETPFGITSGTYIASGVISINQTPTAGGINYLVGDILTCSVGGTGAQVRVTSINTSGSVLSVELVCSGTATGFTTGSGKITTGGTGTGCTINITSVGVTCYVTTATNNWLKTGESITIAGCTVGAYNSTFEILGVNSLTNFSIATPGVSASMVASSSQSTTVIVDSSKSWIVGEHVGKIVQLTVGTGGSSQMRYITANTEKTLTVSTIVAGGNGTSKYSIYDGKAFGQEEQFKQKNNRSFGHATGGSTTTLVDSSMNWNVNQWAGYKFKINSGSGYLSGILTILSNTENTLTYSTQSFTPDSTTHYEIFDTYGLSTATGTTTTLIDTSKKWVVNQFAGKRCKIIAGTGTGQESIISSNTATALTFSAVGAIPDSTTVYTILGCQPKGAGIEMIWISNTSDSKINGKYLVSSRGGASNGIDVYDVTTEKWILSYFISPQQETFTIGSMYAYDGLNTIYMQKDATGRIYSYNIITNRVDNAGTVPYGMGTATIGNRMEVIKTEDGLKYLYIMRHTGQEMWRTLLF